MKRLILFVCLFSVLFTFVMAHGKGSNTSGTDVCLMDKSCRMRLDFITPSVIRVRIASGNDVVFPDRPADTGVCIYKSGNRVKWSKKSGKNSHVTRYMTSDVIVEIDEDTHVVRFLDRKDSDREILRQPLDAVTCEPVVQERVVYDKKSAHMEQTANGKVTVRDVISRDTIGRSSRYTMSFVDGSAARYGLGCQMEDYMNLTGKTLYLTQHNLKVHVPMIVSTGGYGLLFDAGCAMKYDGSRRNECYSMQLEAAKQVDYYFIKGDRLDDVVAGYRYLTGDVSLMPRYVFGFTQSKERYTSSNDIINTLKEYRRRHVPIDMIVQDWNYWPQGWGYMKMDPRFYPSPKALADSVHALNARLMVSIWPNPQYCPEADDFKQRGMMLEHDVYDVFNPEARKLYWKYANDEFFSKGFDAWWCDSSEPLDGDWNRIPATAPDGSSYGWNSHEYRWQLNRDILSESLGAERSSLYSLYHSMGIYENQRLQNPDMRVVNLTRSSYAGQQRYGTIVWNGDTHASWESFRQQIPAGLNYMATGNPYWTVDVGSFFTRDDGRRWFYKGEFPEGVRSDAYKEYYVRMFQWATFLPMLRSHGSDTPREIWQFGAPGTPYYDAILAMIRLRYAHLPYIYSLAARQTLNGYTMARLLAFDFSHDKNVLDLKDEYMFGDYLVCPVTRPVAEDSVRRVYLPTDAEEKDGSACGWYDYWTGRYYDGGKWLECKSEVDHLPLFVRAGSIIPTTEVAEYTDAEAGKTVTLNVYPGRDAEFTLYEDDGNSNDYEKGAYTLIPVKWNDASHTLTIGRRTGSYKSMPASRDFVIMTPASSTTVHYEGKKISVAVNR